MFICWSKKVRYFRNGVYLLQLIDFQQLSELQNILNLCPKIQIHQQMLFHAVNVFNFRTTADYFRVRIEFFFSPKNCGLFSSADYFRVRVIFELIGYLLWIQFVGQFCTLHLSCKKYHNDANQDFEKKRHFDF